MITALEAHLDATLLYRWLVPAPAAVRHTGPLYGESVYLPVRPIDAVAAVAVRAPVVGATPVALVAGQGYDLVDPGEGLLRVAGYGCAVPTPYRVEVDYALVADAPVPADVELVCRREVAAWMGPTLPAGAATGGTSAWSAVAAGVKRYQVGQELMVEFADPPTAAAGSSAGLPGPLSPSAVGTLALYGYPRGPFLGFA